MTYQVLLSRLTEDDFQKSKKIGKNERKSKLINLTKVDSTH